MKGFKFVVVMAAAGALAMSGVAFAAKAPKAPKMDCKAKFESMDANKDGKVSADEWAAAMKGKKNADKSFKAKDKNKDGTITLDEACPPPKAPKAKKAAS